MCCLICTNVVTCSDAMINFLATPVTSLRSVLTKLLLKILGRSDIHSDHVTRSSYEYDNGHCWFGRIPFMRFEFCRDLVLTV